MDKIDAENQANQDVSLLLLRATLSKKLIEVELKIFWLNIKYIAQGFITIDKYFSPQMNSLVKTRVLNCLNYGKELRGEYQKQKEGKGKKELKATGEEMMQKWWDFVEKESQLLSKELIEEQTSDYAETR